MMKALYILPFAAALTACAASNKTVYMAADDPGDYGYYASVLEDNRYRVAYKIKGDDVSTAKDYALLRAAELTLQHGYDWFEVVDRDTNVAQSDKYPATARMRVNATTYRECGLLGCTTVMRPAYVDARYFDSAARTEPESTVTFIEVVMGKSEKPGDGNVYDARSLTSRLSSK